MHGIFGPDRTTAVKVNLHVTSVVAVIALTIVATTYRITTAPERIRLRLNTAKESCLNSGGEWVKVDKHDVCRGGAAGRKG